MDIFIIVLWAAGVGAIFYNHSMSMILFSIPAGYTAGTAMAKLLS